MKEKESPSLFLPIPYLSTQGTTIRMPGSGHTFWFYSFVPWVQREYRALLEISYIDFFFSKELKLGPFKRRATAVPNSIDRRNST